MLENINKKTKNILSIVLLILTIVTIYLNIVSHNETLHLISYSCGYLMITIIFLMKSNPKIELDISLLMIIFYTATIGICPIILAINKSLYYKEQYLFILISYICFIIGYSLMERINRKKFETRKTQDSELKKQKSSNVMKIFSIAILACSVLACAYYVVINKAYIFGGDLENGRITSMSGNGLLLVVIKLSILSGGILFEQYMQKNLKRISIIIISLIVVIVNLLTGFRSGIILYCITILLLYNKRKKINIKAMLILASLVFILFSGIGVLRSGILSGNKSNSIVKSALSTLQGGSINLKYIQEVFPNKVNYKYGYTYLINIIMLKPGPDLDFTLWLKEVLGLKFAGGGVTPTIIGEFYINFGYIGTYIGMLILGAFIFLMQKKYNDENKIVLISYIVALMTNAFRGGIANIEITLLAGVIVFYICDFLNRNIEKILKRFAKGRK